MGLQALIFSHEGANPTEEILFSFYKFEMILGLIAQKTLYVFFTKQGTLTGNVKVMQTPYVVIQVNLHLLKKTFCLTETVCL